MEGGTFSKIKLVKQSWQIFKTHAFSLTFIYAATILLLWFARQVLPQIIQFDFKINLQPNYLIWLVSFIIQSFIALSLVYMALQLDHNRAPSWRDFTAKIDKFFQFALVLFLLSLGFYAGLFFMIVPGLLFLATFILAPYIYINENKSVLSSFVQSYRISKGHILNIITLLAILFIMLFISALTIVGLAIMTPIANITLAKLYDFLTCKYSNSNDCGETVVLSVRQRILVIILLLLLFLYGAWLFKDRVGQKQILNQKFYSKNVSNTEILDKAYLALELYKDNYGAYPNALEDLIDTQILESGDIKNLEYQITDGLYKLCIVGSSICINNSQK